MRIAKPAKLNDFFAWHSDDTKVRANCRIALSRAAGRQVSEVDVDRILGLLRRVVPPDPPGACEKWLERLASVEHDLTSYFKSQTRGSAYVEAFASFVSLLEDELSINYDFWADTYSGYRIPPGMISWYRERLLRISGPALHVSWVSSGSSYSSWIAEFATDPKGAWDKIFDSFPMLLPLLHTAEEASRRALRVALDRFAKDVVLLTDVFGVAAPIIDVEPGLSDCHCGSQTVIRFRFANATSVILKPKPLDIDFRVQEFARANDSHGWGLIPLRIVPCEGYGWMEDAAPLLRGLASSVATGRIAALFWLLNSTDLHAENILGGEGGFRALDLETVLSAPIWDVAGTPDPSWRMHSLLSTQLVDISHGEIRRPNISGLFPDQSLGLLAPSIRFEVVGDQVEIRRTPADRRTGLETPIWSTTTEFDLANMTRAFADAASNDRRSLARFIEGLPDNLVVRLVLRDTVFYANVLARIRQPRFLRDGMAFSYDILSLFGAQLATKPLGARPDFQILSEMIVADEIAQLLAGDVPYFCARIGDREAILSHCQLPSTFSRSGKSWALDKLRCLTESDIAEQCSLLRLSLGQWYQSAAKGRSLETFESQLATAAEELASEAFLADALPARWLGMIGDARHNELRVSIGQRDFFSGSWGVLVGIEAATTAAGAGLEDFLDREAGAWQCLLDKRDGFRGAFFSSGLGFNGIGGLAFAIALLNRIAPQRWRFLLAPFVRYLAHAREEIVSCIENDSRLDVIAGSAGLVLGLDRLTDVLTRKTDSSLLAAVEGIQFAGAHHLACALRDVGEAKGWITSETETPNLGYAHGWAGIIVALSAACRRTRHETLTQALGNAANFPNSRYRHYGAWVDFRHNPPRPLNRSWCNGAAGLLRGLLETFASSDLREGALLELRDQLTVGLSTSDTRRFCCGEMGTLDVLLDLKSSEVEATHFSAIGRQILSATLGSRNAPEAQLPSLFQGRSGIIYTAARCLRPDFPSLSAHEFKVGSVTNLK